MKKKIQKLCSLFLVAFILFNFYAGPVLALVENGEENDAKQVGTKTERFGTLEVDTHFTLPLKNVETSHIVLILKDEKGNTLRVPFEHIPDTGLVSSETFDGNSISVSVRKLDYKGIDLTIADNNEYVSYYAVKFDHLKTGTYTIQLTGDGYQSYELSNITLDDYSKRVTLTNQNGLFAVGDTNRDGIIDQKDVNDFLEHIGQATSDDLLIYDFNRDGIIDLVDFYYLATSLNHPKESAKIVDTNVIVDTTQTTLSGDITSGTVNDLFESDLTKTVTLEPVQANPISKENPVKMELAFVRPIETEQIRFQPNQNSMNNAPSEIEVTVETEDGKTLHFTKKLVELNDLHFFTDKASENVLVIDLGGQIAVKKMTITVIKTANNTNLAEISKVEFLNNVYEEVPAPKMDIPTALRAEEKSEAALLFWNHAANVTGYEVRLEEKNGDSVFSTKIYQTTYNQYEIKELDNYKTYYVSVRSVNGEWKSPFSDAILVTPKPTRLAPSPENISVEGKFQALQLSWKKMKDTLNYNLYYREKGTSNFSVIRDINATHYLLEGLKGDITYELYLTGNNHLGEGSKSNTVLGTTIAPVAPNTTNYKLINTTNGTNEITSHIKSVTYPIASSAPIDSFDIVDNDYTSYWNYNSWTAGGYAGNPNGPIVEFDDAYEMDHIIFVSGDDEPSYYEYLRLDYWDQDGVRHTIKNDRALKLKTSTNGKKYYEIWLDEPIKATKVQVNLSLYWAGAPNARVRIVEMKFYSYDSIEHDVENLFTDDLHITLKNDVTLDQIQILEDRVNTKDAVSGEYHPNRDILLQELSLARDILNDKAISDIFTVDQTISNARNSHLGFAMQINDYQPLGRSVRSGDTITVYVGTQGTVLPQLVFTQFYGESAYWTQTVNLQKGKNVITVPKIGSMDVEHGGSIYVRYPSATSTNNPIQIRVSGGVKIPTLNLYGVDDEMEMKSLIRNYITSLNEYVKNLPSYYNNRPTIDENGSTIPNIYPYDPSTSVLNVTEIGMQQGLYSVSATQALSGITGSLSTLDEQVDRLYHSVIAFGEMMDLFYQEKGLYENPDVDQDGVVSESEAKHKMPGSRINIRQMRMFDGAFMYAGGLHIGIGSGSVPGLMQGRPNTISNGVVKTTGFFGWGISHEIGHQIDEGDMIFGETTNNIYSLFAQTNDDLSLSRLETSNIYPMIYDKVTSGTTGISSNVFVTLGMFWQLHLAYDTTATLTDQNSFYAKLNRLYRTTSLKADRDNLLIMLASTVVSKDLTDFFRSWGLVPSTETLAYLKEQGFAKETRKIQYLNDGARRYGLNHGFGFNDTTQVSATLKQQIDDLGNPQKKIDLTFTVNQEQDRVLGYEILRNGTPIAFVTEDHYTDVLGAINNRSFTYEVIAYDNYLNPTKSYRFDPIKVTYDGSVDKSKMTISSNFRNNFDIDLETDNAGTILNSSLKNLLDEKKDTFFHGNTRLSTTDKTEPYIILEFNQQLALSGLKYTAQVTENTLHAGTIQKYEIYISNDRINWTKAKTGTFNVSANDPTATVYFDGPNTTGGNQLWTYQASYLKIVAKGNTTISGNELNFIAPPGDNVEMDSSHIGILKEDFVYAEGSENIIPQGSIIFQGEYRGNPAYNALLLIDEKGKVANGGTLLFANLPTDGPLDEIASGTWIFYTTVEEYQKLSGAVHVNLYRVDDALTSDGQRLVSDTIPYLLPDFASLPQIEIQK